QRKREALAELARAVEDAERAENLAKSGRWDLAAEAYGKFVDQEPDNFVLRQAQIRALLAANDVAGARRACEVQLKRSANATLSASWTTNLAFGNTVVWPCALTPDAVADPGVPVRLAEDALKLHAVTEREGSDRLRILGAALYRAGRFTEAIRTLEERHRGRGDGGDPQGFAFLALAYHRLGHRAEARRWLDKLAAYRPKETGDLSWDDVEIRILRREAESLILGGPPRPPHPPPPRRPRRRPFLREPSRSDAPRQGLSTRSEALSPGSRSGGRGRECVAWRDPRDG